MEEHHGAFPQGNDSSTESEAENSCPLCMMDEIEPEHASASLTTNNYMRRIMAQELVGYGTTPDKIIYSKIARMYNRHIYKSMTQSNYKCQRWTRQLVQMHFEHHVWLLPRRVIGNMVKELLETMNILRLERINALKNADDDSSEIVDSKFVTKMCNLAAKIATLTREYRTYQKEDTLHTQVANLYKAIDLGTTSVTEAKDILDRVALIQSTAGGGDRPKANELFKE